MELRRKEHAVRQVSKQMSYMENEKNALVDRLNDAEKTMTAAARLVGLVMVNVSRWLFGKSLIKYQKSFRLLLSNQNTARAITSAPEIDTYKQGYVTLRSNFTKNAKTAGSFTS